MLPTKVTLSLFMALLALNGVSAAPVPTCDCDTTASTGVSIGSSAHGSLGLGLGGLLGSLFGGASSVKAKSGLGLDGHGGIGLGGLLGFGAHGAGEIKSSCEGILNGHGLAAVKIQGILNLCAGAKAGVDLHAVVSSLSWTARAKLNALVRDGGFTAACDGVSVGAQTSIRAGLGLDVAANFSGAIRGLLTGSGKGSVVAGVSIDGAAGLTSTCQGLLAGSLSAQGKLSGVLGACASLGGVGDVKIGLAALSADLKAQLGGLLSVSADLDAALGLLDADVRAKLQVALGIKAGAALDVKLALGGFLGIDLSVLTAGGVTTSCESILQGSGSASVQLGAIFNTCASSGIKADVSAGMGGLSVKAKASLKGLLSVEADVVKALAGLSVDVRSKLQTALDIKASAAVDIRAALGGFIGADFSIGGGAAISVNAGLKASLESFLGTTLSGRAKFDKLLSSCATANASSASITSTFAGLSVSAQGSLKALFGAKGAANQQFKDACAGVKGDIKVKLEAAFGAGVDIHAAVGGAIAQANVGVAEDCGCDE